MTLADTIQDTSIRDGDAGAFRSTVLCGLVAACSLAIASTPASAQDRMTRITESGPGHGTNDAARDLAGGSLSISADGRYVAFDSNATNLVDLDVNGNHDSFQVFSNVFIKEVASGSLVRITTGNGDSLDPVLSRDGRYVAFLSSASNLIASDANATTDVFLHDRDPDGNGIFDEGNGTTIRVSVSSSGNEIHGNCYSPSISDDGSRIAFISEAADVVNADRNGSPDAFLRDVVAGTTKRVSVGTKGGEAKLGGVVASISGDGSTVAFESLSDDIVPGDTNGDVDIFIYDVAKAKTVERVSVDSNGIQGNDNSSITTRCLSHDGSIVAFTSLSTNFVANDTNGSRDVFIHDRTSKQTLLVSQSTGGQIGNFESLYATIDSAGDRVAFTSASTNFDSADQNTAYDVYVHDFSNGTTALVSIARTGLSGDLQSAGSVIAPAGDVVVFDSDANDLAMGDSNGFRDVFARDLAHATTSLLSASPPIQAGVNYGYGYYNANWDGDSDVSRDGRWVAFASWATNLIPTQFREENIYVKDRLSGALVLVSQKNGVDGDLNSYRPSISDDGRYVVFSSWAQNWGYGAYWGPNVYLFDRDPDGNGIFDEGNGALELISGWGGTNTPIDSCGSASVSGNGRYVAFSAANAFYLDQRCDLFGDRYDLFVRDRVTGITTLLSVNSSGTKDGNDSSDGPEISDDGNVIVFVSYASDLVAGDTDHLLDVYAWNRSAGTMTLVSVNSSGVKQQAIAEISRRPVSFDGNSIVFACNDPHFDSNKTTSYFDVYLRDLGAGVTTDISTIKGVVPDADCVEGVISRDAEFVAYSSTADNLFANDSNGASDVFCYDLGTGGFICASNEGASGNADSWSNDPIVFDYPGQIAFASAADNLVHGDTNAYPDIFVFDPSTPHGAAEWSNYGNGFPGTFGVPALTMRGNPVLGTTVTTNLGNSRHATTMAMLLISPRAASIPTNFGATWLVDLGAMSTLGLTEPAAGLSIAGALPSDPALAGVSVYLQAVEFDPGAVKNLSFTRGLELDLETY